MDKTRMQQYMSQMRAMFNKHALYSDESRSIRFRLSRTRATR